MSKKARTRKKSCKQSAESDQMSDDNVNCNLTKVTFGVGVLSMLPIETCNQADLAYAQSRILRIHF